MAKEKSPVGCDIVLAEQSELTDRQRQDIHTLQVGCFSDVPVEEIYEDFVAPAIANVLAADGENLVGCVSVFERQLDYEGRAIHLGGFGGTCVRPVMRGRGIGSLICRRAMEHLRQLGCDIAMLAIGRESGTDRLYEQFGFELLSKPFTFVSASGYTKSPVRDTVAMVAPVCSPETFRFVMEGSNPLHLGPEPGYW